MIRSQRAWLVTALLVAGLALPSCAYVQRWEARKPVIQRAAALDNRPVSVLLRDGLALVRQQLAEQQQQLATARTEVERQAIAHHLDSLRQQQALLEELHDQLIGPSQELREAAREQQSEHRAQRHENILEQDQRFPTP